MTNLKDLADRVEALTEPCRETDLRIGVAVNYGGHFAEGKCWHWNANSELECNGPGYLDPRLLPRFTASVDAALTLVPDGMEFRIDYLYDLASVTVVCNSPEFFYGRNNAARIPCAITAACLRAMNTKKPATD